MSGRKLRIIKVGRFVYFWCVHQRHHEEVSSGARCSTEVFTAFKEDCRYQPLRILFPEGADHGAGYPGQRGVVVDYHAPKRPLNLNRPRLARLLIELGIASGWAPGTSRHEFLVENGFKLLRRRSADVKAALAPDSRGQGR